ncbi:AAA family ATPase [uncultured Pseudacidovorax sp.]|uniref:AAA family ATPase n=1 Tax=uncultured Pseudacidovorax sp. TaxID=679313 RepID=UPI0025FE24A4|nr:AAA family ATPase [uncultured Pseudacidovorax sp.]
MKIDTISIEGYKSFAKVDQFALGNLNVLIGANGAGKSNFLSLFRLLTAASQGNLQTYVKSQGGPDVLLHGGRKRTPQLSIALKFRPNGGVVNGYDITLAPTADNRIQFVREVPWIDGDYVVKRYELGSAHEEARLLTDRRQVSHYVSRWMKSWQQFHFHDTSEGAAVKLPHPSNDNLRLKPQADNLAAYLYRLRALPSHQAAYQRIVDTIKLAAPFFGGFVEREPMPDTVELEWFEQSDPETPYRAHTLSDGTLRFICLTTLLLQPSHLLPDTILIDEPELGLHPFAINLLADMMKELAQTKQLIVSTQSVELLNAMEPKDVVVAQRVDGATTLERLDVEELRGWLDDYQSLGELWKRNVIGGRPSL